MTELPPTEAPFVLATTPRDPQNLGDTDLYLPDGDAAAGVIVFVHGMPYPPDWPTPRTWPVYRGYGAAAAEHGFAGAVITHSGGGRPDYEHSAAKLAEALDAVRAHPRVDADRVALWHFSGGGPLSADYLRRPPAWLRCLALTYPLLEDLRDFGIPPRLHPASAVAHSGGLPIVLTNPGLEKPDLAAAAARFTEAATEAAANLTVIDVPDGVHGFDFADHTQQSRDAVTEALDLVEAELKRA